MPHVVFKIFLCLRLRWLPASRYIQSWDRNANVQSFCQPSPLPHFLSGQRPRNSNLHVPHVSPLTMPLGVVELHWPASHPSVQALMKIGDGCCRGCRGNALIYEACTELRVAGPRTHLVAGSKQFFPALMDQMWGTKPMSSRFFTDSCRVRHPRWVPHDRGQGDRNLWRRPGRRCQLFTRKKCLKSVTF